MFGFEKQKVSKVVYLEIEYNLDAITAWIDADFSGDLLKLDAWAHGNDENVIKYGVELLPHPNGVDSIFYHRHANIFSNHLGAADYFRSSKLPNKSMLKEVEKNIYGVEWDLHQLGFLRLMILPTKGDERRLILLAPTPDIYQLHIGNTLKDTTNYITREYKDEIITVDDDKVTGKVYRGLLGLVGGKGVTYHNGLCRVKAYLPDSVMLYDQYTSG